MKAETHQKEGAKAYPTLGEIVRRVRKAKHLSQEAVAFRAGASQDIISRIEIGDYKPTKDVVRGIKIAFNMEWIPFFPEERQACRMRMKEWFDAIDAQDMKKADAMANKLAEIMYLPHEVELNAFYQAIALGWRLLRKEMVPALSLIEKIEPKVDMLADVQKYYYYFNKGIFQSKLQKYEEALTCFLAAHDLIEAGVVGHAKLYYNIGYCYWILGYGYKAILFFEKMGSLYPQELTGNLGYQTNLMLTTCYININNLKMAKEMLDSRYAKAESKPNSEEMADILTTYGCLYRKAGDKELAIEYFDKALACPGLKDQRRVEVIYHKIWCLLEQGFPVACAELISEGKELVEKIDNAEWREEYLTCFDGQEAVANIDSRDCREYLEDVIFPYFVKHGANYAIMDFSTFLIPNYRKKKRPKSKVAEMMLLVYDIQDKMMEGGGLA